MTMMRRSGTLSRASVTQDNKFQFWYDLSNQMDGIRLPLDIDALEPRAHLA